MAYLLRSNKRWQYPETALFSVRHYTTPLLTQNAGPVQFETTTGIIQAYHFQVGLG